MSTVDVDRVDPGVLRITLNRPSALNALTLELVQDLAAALDEVQRDADCRVVLLTGAGRGFCAGIDLNGYGDDALLERSGRTYGTTLRQDAISHVALRLHDLRQPVIAVVNGAAAGGGLSLALCADIRMASTTAVFSAAYLRAGYTGCDLGSSWLLPRLVGTGRAHELILTARRVEAAEALHIGLVTSLHAPTGLLDAARAMAQQIQLGPPLSVELTKRGLWAGLETPSLAAAVQLENRLQVLSSLTEDQAEASLAWKEKRAPAYQGR